MRDDPNHPPGVFTVLLRLFCSIGIALFLLLILLGCWNIYRLLRGKQKSSGTQALITMYYVFMLLALCSSCFVDSWRLFDPSLVGDADDPSELPFIQALVEPSYWGLFMTVVLSMYQLGIMIQRIQDEIDSRGMRCR